MSLDAPHTMMNKFRSPEDANFKRVAKVLKSMAQEARSIVEAQHQGKPQNPSIQKAVLQYQPDIL